MSTTPEYILALDLGTTGNRAILFNRDGNVVSQAYKELPQYYPHPGWLEHDGMEIWRDTREMTEKVLIDTDTKFSQVGAIGLTVQRETCLLWDKTTGKPFHKAIVWQDRRTTSLCNELRKQGKAEEIQEKTGLVLDAYFSATKLAWLLDWLKTEQPDVNMENVLAGTVDTWVLWNLTGGKVHATDRSNASRTMLMNLASGTWDLTLLDLFGIPSHIMPEIKPSMGEFGRTDLDLFGAEIPVTAIFGDQQAALFAHGCDRPGLLKCTYGTGCFLVAQAGTELTRSHNRLLSTVAWTTETETKYALEAAMFTTGASIQWLRDGLNLIQSASETDALARQAGDNNGVYFVPALSGLGAPHWDMNARGSFQGITGGVKREHIVRSVLESIAYQVKEAVEAMNKDGAKPVSLLKVDGGGSKNDFLMQFQADILGIPVERPAVQDATAQGAAFGAGLAIGFWESYESVIAKREIDRTFTPGEGQTQAQEGFQVWLRAVERAKNWLVD
ncbi:MULTISPECIES: glycerol kinase GlpK [Spirulina sp. CCY15215]|uniref:glycerol kinase GlpK n=1 Tax=Spirulina sp. CCY15215 TaxID=2767591 RepID=UPI00194FC375|nr:glycerol kinase GlpK [Spirulina major]